MKATLNGHIIAESEDTVLVEGNHYFPVSSVKKEYLIKSDYHSTCPWKGVASYYTISVNGDIRDNAAWYYPNPKPGAEMVKDRIAFWKGVRIER
jgi:uncharacterized protein (DUF427 family)